METYRTEEEQVEALRRWWDENGRSTIVGIVLALVAAFGWQGWQDHRQGQREQASDQYQQFLEAAASEEQSMARLGEVERLAESLKADFPGTTYARFAALHLARLAVIDGDLGRAETELRWVLSEADAGSDMALIAQQRLARVLAAAGDVDRALELLASPGDVPLAATYSLARGDVLLEAGRRDEARAAYLEAQSLASRYPGQAGLQSLQQKLRHLTPKAPVELPADLNQGGEAQP